MAKKTSLAGTLVKQAGGRRKRATRKAAGRRKAKAVRSDADILREVQAGCAGADAGFLLEQVNNRATVEQARTAWIAELNRRLADATGDG